jgi:hypothetical protein
MKTQTEILAYILKERHCKGMSCKGYDGYENAGTPCPLNGLPDCREKYDKRMNYAEELEKQQEKLKYLEGLK